MKSATTSASTVVLFALSSLAGTVTAQWEDTGCVMDPDSDLMRCLGSYASVPPAAPSGLANNDQAAYYCNMYQQLANCWAPGLYCREWLPLQTAADKFCALANGTLDATSMPPVPLPEPITTPIVPAAAATGTSSVVAAVPAASVTEVATETLSSVIAEASNVVTSIWNNDVGTAIPLISNEFATDTRATWTHVTTATAEPASDPITPGMTVIPAPTALRRRLVTFAREEQ